ncbi:MAG: methyltransferase domain-containing protein [Chloroflexota bacterium]|nr:methyltransferase domain-containing protein [Chloroflexota bacterium]
MSQLINDLTPEALRAAVATQYGKVALQPKGRFPFPVGRAFAESLSYPPNLLDTLPRPSVDAFAGISYPLKFADLQPGESVLDLGCGAAMDTILAARQVGESGHIHSLDLSDAMLECARANVVAAGLGNVTFHCAPAEEIPLADGSVDVVVVNGIFNLCPSKKPVIDEVFRVLRTGGRTVVSEIVLRDLDDGEWVGATCDLGGDGLAGLTLENWFQ